MPDIALDIARPDPPKTIRIYGAEYQLARRDDLPMAALNRIAREWSDLGQALDAKGQDINAFTDEEIAKMTTALRWICGQILPAAPASLFDGTSPDTLNDSACLQIAQLFFDQASILPAPQNRAERRAAQAQAATPKA